MLKTKTAKILTLLLVFCCAIAALAFTACGTGAKITLDNETLNLSVNGKDGTIRATLEPATNGAIYEWTVADQSVATIKPSQSVCRVTPLKEGTTTVTVTVGNESATCTVNVGPDQHVKLHAPSFTYDESTGVITITDPNTAGVGSYRLDFYADGEVKGDVTVENGKEVDTRRIEKGTYTVKLVAIGADEQYYDSEPSSTTAEITVTVDALYSLGKGDDAVKDTANRWGYYSYEWVVVDTYESYCYDGEVQFVFSNNVGNKDYTWITQLIYNYGHGEAGQLYKMVLNINTTMGGRVSLGGKPVTLKEGDNLVTVGIDGNNLFKINFGVSGEATTLTDATVKVSIVGDIVATDLIPLAVPESFTYNSENNTISITDNVNSEYDVIYTLGFFEKEDDESPKGTAVVTDGGEVDITSVGTGNYYLKLMAASAGRPYKSSGWTAVLGHMGVVNNKVPVPNGGQGVSATNTDKWYEWHPTKAGGMSQEVVVEECYVDDEGAIHFTYDYQEGSGKTYQPLKLHYNVSAINEGDVYTLTLKVQSPVDGYITVNGKICEIKKDVVNDISVTRAQPNKDNGGGMRTTITIQMGAQLPEEDGGEVSVVGSFVISDIVWQKITVTPLEAVTFNYNSETQVVTVSNDPNGAEKVSGYEIGFFESETAAEPLNTALIAEDGTYDSSAIGSGTYYLRARAIPAEPVNSASPWSGVLGSVGVVTERIDIASGGFSAAASNQGTWFYYKENATTIGDDGVYLDQNNDIHITFSVTASANTDQPIKLMYNKADINQNDVHTLTCKVSSPVDGYITVNGQVFEVKADEVTEISVTRKQPNKSGSDAARGTITITFGATVEGNKVHVQGAFVISDIVLVKNDVTQLEAPAFTYDADTKTVTVNDTANAADDVQEYVLGLFAEGADEPVKTYTVEDSLAIDLTDVANGTYTLKLMAKSSTLLHTDSDWYSTETATVITVENAGGETTETDAE